MIQRLAYDLTFIFLSLSGVSALVIFQNIILKLSELHHWGAFQSPTFP
jgi:hypothetical protein